MEDKIRQLCTEADDSYIFGLSYEVQQSALYGRRLYLSFCDIFQCRNPTVNDLVWVTKALVSLFKNSTLETFTKFFSGIMIRNKLSLHRTMSTIVHLLSHKLFHRPC
jgi:hypothetical protein